MADCSMFSALRSCGHTTFHTTLPIYESLRGTEELFTAETESPEILSLHCLAVPNERAWPGIIWFGDPNNPK